MKIFGWMKPRGNWKEGNGCPLDQDLRMKYHTTKTRLSGEEFDDWPDSLLSIGTFGSSSFKDSRKDSQGGLSSSSSKDHLEHIYPEGCREIDKELRLLLNRHVSVNSSLRGKLEKHNMSLENILDSLSQNVGNTMPEKRTAETDDSDLQQTISAVFCRQGKQNTLNNKRSGNAKRYVTLILEKAFKCRGRILRNPVLREPIPEPKLDDSRIDKILRIILNRKVYPQRSSSPKIASKKYLDMHARYSDDEEREEATNGSKWVKTDSEYIVLEM